MINSSSASQLIRQLQLAPHPEGGWYREIFRSRVQVETAHGARCGLTTIYYLLERDQVSRWHVVSAAEIWHFYAGAPLELLTYDLAAAAAARNLLGSPGFGLEPVAVVEAGVWQAARTTGEYTLVGCSVGPGFEFADFQFVRDLPGHDARFVGQLSGLRDLL